LLAGATYKLFLGEGEAAPFEQAAEG